MLQPDRLVAQADSQNLQTIARKPARTMFRHRRPAAQTTRPPEPLVMPVLLPPRPFAPEADEFAPAHPDAETAPRATPRPVVESSRDKRRRAQSHCPPSDEVPARTTRTNAIVPEQRTRTRPQISGTRALPQLAAQPHLHSFRAPRHNTRTTTKIRAPGATCAPRAPPSAPAPVRSTRCSAEPTPTTPLIAPNSPIAPTDIGHSSLPSNTRNFEPRIADQTVVRPQNGF